MKTIRARLDLIAQLEKMVGDEFLHAETAAFHGRKVVEAISFACLVATENGLKDVPKDAKGQWNAETIFNRLQKKEIHTFPSPSAIRFATETEQKVNGVRGTIEGIPERRLSHTEVIAIYKLLHRWLHELNPYIAVKREEFYAENAPNLWSNLSRLNRFIEQHFISIQGSAFFCVLRDEVDGETKVAALEGHP